ncbi:MAG: Glycosyl phosphatidyl inositol protein transamidase complex subunit [Chrysothrix sp. TS-e1954]|nr:MAG: Glycosyl phosphatidyl inositol protein transamidase complex subunit [Chrysothrix sp. TS-e1954]
MLSFEAFQQWYEGDETEDCLYDVAMDYWVGVEAMHLSTRQQLIQSSPPKLFLLEKSPTSEGMRAPATAIHGRTKVKKLEPSWAHTLRRKVDVVVGRPSSLSCKLLLSAAEFRPEPRRAKIFVSDVEKAPTPGLEHSRQALRTDENDMAFLIPAILSLRRDPRLLKLPPFLSLFCIFIGLAWLLVLPTDEYSRRTYISENALLPGQVHTYFGGSEHTVFRAYRHEVAALVEAPPTEVADKLGDIFNTHGLKVARQKYSYTSAGQTISGENVYAILEGPRADATEAMVLAAAWRNMDGVVNQSGVALVLTLARYFKRWSLWSKDIILLITTDSTAGPQAWVDAYYDAHDTSSIQSLPLKSGALQGGLFLDYPAGTNGHRYDKLLIHYDGVNGQLPNLDLFNTVTHIAANHLGVGVAIQQMSENSETYPSRLKTIMRGMFSQGLGHATGPHSSFMPYHVDAITLQTIGDGWHDEMSLGKVAESSIRSINNLLEHLHQSFFFYLLMEAQRFVSIGTYLPSAMLIAVNFAIMSISLWILSGRPREMPDPAKTAKPATKDEQGEGENVEVMKHDDMVAIVPAQVLATSERHLFAPVLFIGIVHFLGLVPLYLFNTLAEPSLITAFLTTAMVTLLLPPSLAYILHASNLLTPQGTTLISCFSLLLLSVILSTLSTLNFSLGLIVGLLASPLSFALPASKHPIYGRLYSRLLNLIAPTTVLLIGGLLWRGSGAGGWKGVQAFEGVKELLMKASFAWTVHGTWTAVVVWVVWWPAWITGAVVAGMGALEAKQERREEVQGDKSAAKS